MNARESESEANNFSHVNQDLLRNFGWIEFAASNILSLESKIRVVFLVGK